MSNQALLDDARYIAVHIMPVTPKTTEARERILAAVDSGALDEVVKAICENRALFLGKVGRDRGVMTPEVRLLADNWLAKVEAVLKDTQHSEAGAQVTAA